MTAETEIIQLVAIIMTIGSIGILIATVSIHHIKFTLSKFIYFTKLKKKI